MIRKLTMIDKALIDKCADQSLAPAIVEQFVAAAGSDDPLAISVRIGARLVLMPKPRDPDAAVETIRDYVGQASVRVGLTQYPAGFGLSDRAQLTPAMFDACSNLRVGTALFAKVARIVTRWYGRPTNRDLTPQMVDDAIYAWKTGMFEGTRVFQADDPKGPTFVETPLRQTEEAVVDHQQQAPDVAAGDEQPDTDAGNAGIRVDLSRIGVR
jgi:hypothetical protein